VTFPPSPEPPFTPRGEGGCSFVVVQETCLHQGGPGQAGARGDRMQADFRVTGRGQSGRRRAAGAAPTPAAPELAGRHLQDYLPGAVAGPPPPGISRGDRVENGFRGCCGGGASWAVPPPPPPPRPNAAAVLDAVFIFAFFTPRSSLMWFLSRVVFPHFISFTYCIRIQMYINTFSDFVVRNVNSTFFAISTFFLVSTLLSHPTLFFVPNPLCSQRTSFAHWRSSRRPLRWLPRGGSGGVGGFPPTVECRPPHSLSVAERSSRNRPATIPPPLTPPPSEFHVPHVQIIDVRQKNHQPHATIRPLPSVAKSLWMSTN